MYFLFSWWSYLILLPGIILASIAQLKVTSTFNKYNGIASRANWTASDASRMLLEKSGCQVTVNIIGGHLSDNYNPSNRTLNLSQTTYNSSSIASLGVAAHEVGHACQHKTGYLMLKLRSALVPIVNLGSRLAFPLVIVGIILEYILVSNPTIGTWLVGAGIIGYGLTTVFALITLPVEFDASRRALKMLEETNLLEKDELNGAKKVLSAATMTYVASLVVSLLYLLRFLLIVARLRKKD